MKMSKMLPPEIVIVPILITKEARVIRVSLGWRSAAGRERAGYSIRVRSCKHDYWRGR